MPVTKRTGAHAPDDVAPPAPASDRALREEARAELAELTPFFRFRQIHYHIAGRSEQYGTLHAQYRTDATLSLEPTALCRTDRCRRGFLLSPEDAARLAIHCGMAPDHPEVLALTDVPATTGIYLSDDAAQEVFAHFLVAAQPELPR